MPPPISSPHRAKRLRAPSLRLPGADDEATKLLTPLLDRLSRAVNSISHDDASAITLLLDPLLQLRPLLASSTGRYKDDFRLLKGLDLLFDLFASLSSHEPSITTTFQSDLLLLTPAVLGLLSEALCDHVLNRQHFEALRVQHGDPDPLLLFLGRQISEERHASRIFGHLLSCATHDESICRDFETDVSASSASGSSQKNVDYSRYYLHLPEFFPLLLQVWKLCSRSDSLPGQIEADSPLSLSLINAMCEVSQVERNAIQLTHTALLGTLLDVYQPTSSSGKLEVALRKLILTSTRLGLRSLKEADKLFRLGRENEYGASLLLDCVRTARQPPHILFDMTITGFSSLEFPELPHAFPPQEPASGYSFLAWIKITSFDPSSHTTIFGAFDESQSCFVLIYIERGSQHLVLQTSVTSSKPSIRFKSTTFELDRWYHIALVQKRPKGDGPSQVALFVDGELAEHAKCSYPRIPASSRHRAPPGSFASRFEVVQGFYGTPRDLSPRLGPDMVSSSWALASSHLFSEAIPDDLIFVYKSLGPEYHGNFQDALGSFQTFKASAALNLRNEHFHPGKEDQSVISRAVRSSASQFNSERNVILGVSPSTMLHKRPGAESLAPWTTVAGALNSSAFESLRNKTRNGANSLVLNSRTPLVEDALLKPTGTGILVGPSLVSSAMTLGDAAWLYSGCLAIGLDLIKAATSPKSLVCAVEATLTLINDSWRNSEIAERENGFGMIAFALTRKLQYLDRRKPDPRPLTSEGHLEHGQESTKLQLLRKILSFVGYDAHAPERSRIVNPLAYRALLVDCVVWRSADVLTQELYYKQFCVFSQQSKYRAFNIRRLNRMRIIKRIIDSLKGSGVEIDTKADLLQAFECILRGTSSADIYRSVALFITAALQEGKLRSPSLPSRLRSVSSRSFQPPSPLGSSDDSETIVRGPQLGIAVLEMLSESLANDVKGAHVRKFANSVTNKWLLHLLAEDDDTITALAMRILACTFGLLGPPYVERFEKKTKGFLILQERLKTKWQLEDVWSSCFTILFGMDKHVSALDPNKLIPDLKRAGAPIAYPAIMPTMLTMLGRGLNSASNPASPGKGKDSISPVLRSFQALYKGYAPFKDFSSESSFARDVIKIAFDPNHGQTVGADPFLSDDMGAEASFLGPDQEGLVQTPPVPRNSRALSFVMIESGHSRLAKTPALLLPLTPGMRSVKAVTSSHSGEQVLIDSLCAIHVDQILRRKEFTGLGLFLKAPPAPLQYRAHLTSHLTRDVAKKLTNELQTNALLFQEPRVLNNLARFVTQTCEALFEGWLVASETSLLNLITFLLHYLESPEMQTIKSIRLCSPQLAAIRGIGRQIAIFALLVNQTNNEALEDVLATLLAMQDLLIPREADEEAEFRTVAAILYRHLFSDVRLIRNHAESLVKSLVAQKPDVVATSLTNGSTEGEMQVGVELCLNIQQNDDLASWLHDNQAKLDAFFVSGPDVALAEFVDEKNRAAQASAAARVEKRKSRLEQWHLEEVAMQHAITEQDLATKNWNSNIHEAEMIKYQRSRQDQHESNDYLEGLCQRQETLLREVQGLRSNADDSQWQLDESEGRDRMRMRLVHMDEKSDTTYQPKRRTTNPPKVLETGPEDVSTAVQKSSKAASTRTVDARVSEGVSEGFNGEDDFEVIAEPQKPDDSDQDKNRRVMRSLQPGESVEDARNVSVVRGLEAQETLMIMGHKSLYLIENLFLKADGEVVNSWDAPAEERDPYIKMISGQKVEDHVGTHKVDVKPKRWAWSDIVSISERQFLLRDVAIEIFFKDGRSYLATAISKTQRDQISAKLNAKSLAARESQAQTTQESAWRTAIVRASRDSPSSFGSKVVGLFNTSSAKAARRRWQKGEMSNFQYLMLVNSLAGRTFNDLTQYPVFPWVIADYSSEELDLSNPHAFRDLTKPMGCQTPERESAFRDRYSSFAEMDPETPAFHYGTHYSSAMIVSSFLIRLQPFVKSYLLLQGGAFDHAERLFDSVEKAWKSASREGFTDIRELTPEFFYLPDFLVNLNRYNFGTKQSTGETINDVILPKWAKGDPAVFVAKNREALESPYVSQNLHHWIDLIFGFKQRGEAAIESTNVFHHLSYQGAKDLDTIQDERERVATIGIIHNFGQTPQQVFGRPHERRETVHGQDLLKIKTYESLTRPGDPITVSSEQVWHVETKNLARDRRRAVYPPWRVPMPSDSTLELIWGLTDQSLRLLSSGGGKFLHIREQPHSDQISAVVWGEDKTAYSASEDGTIHAWNIVLEKGAAEIQQRGSTLLGHQSPVEHLAISNALGTLVSADREGRVLTWSISTLELVRCVMEAAVITSISINDLDGTIACCTDDSVQFFTLNGRMLHKQAICTWDTGAISSCVWAKQESGSDITNRIFASGHHKGIVQLWNLHISPGGQWQLDHIRQLEHESTAQVTYILPLLERVYVGLEDGRLYEWTGTR